MGISILDFDPDPGLMQKLSQSRDDNHVPLRRFSGKIKTTRIWNCLVARNQSTTACQLGFRTRKANTRKCTTSNSFASHLQEFFVLLEN